MIKNILNFSIWGVLGILILYNPIPAQAYQNVKVDNRQLMEDFDHDGSYKPFFVKGVNYLPLPIGHFIGSGTDKEGNSWGPSDCQYIGPYPLNFPDRRFDHNSPDADKNFQCSSDVSDEYQDLKVLDRDFTLLSSMHANTIRIWTKNITPQLLQKAKDYGLKIITVYWVDHNIDYTFPNDKDALGQEITGSGDVRRQALINDYVSYVNAAINADKDNPAILMWGLSNENNLHFCDPCNTAITNCNRGAQAEGYFRLMNEMAQAAKDAEGSSFHPTTIVLGNWTQDVVDYKDVLTAIDIIGFNAYYGRNFDLSHQDPPDSGNWVKYSNLFIEAMNQLPNKGIMITEFGVDAWNTNGHYNDPENGVEDQISQADWDSSAWDEIVAYSAYGGPSNGGVVYNYSDFWNGYAERPANAGQCDWVSSDWTPSVRTQDYGFTDPAIFGYGSFPDNRENREWWGIVAVEKNPIANELDIIKPRLVYYALQEKFSNHPPVLNPIGNINANIAGSFEGTVSITAQDPEGDVLTFITSSLPSGVSLVDNPQEADPNKKWLRILNTTQLGTYPITITVRDSHGLEDSGTFTLTVTNHCFIATAAYGTPMATEVQSLRNFRDQVLLKSEAGQEFVQWYYRTSPPIANTIAQHEWMRAGVRTILNPIVKLTKWYMNR